VIDGKLIKVSIPMEVRERQLNGNLAATPPSDSSEDGSTPAVSKPTTKAGKTWRDNRANLLKPHYKRLEKLRKPNTIVGICMDENGQPLSGVTVQIVSQRTVRSGGSDKLILPTHTDRQGEFRFVGVSFCGCRRHRA